MSISDQVRREEGEKLKLLLERGNVPYHAWGLPGTATNTFEDLLEDMLDGSVRFMSTEAGGLVCFRESICVEVTYSHPTKGKLRLWEDERTFEDGFTRARNKPLLMESRKPGEYGDVTAARCLKEEINVDIKDKTRIVLDPSPQIGPIYVSEFFPGLRTRRFMTVYRCILRKNEYRFEYREKQGSFKSVCRWHDVSEIPAGFENVIYSDPMHKHLLSLLP